MQNIDLENFSDVLSISLGECHLTLNCSAFTLWTDCNWRLVRGEDILCSSIYNSIELEKYLSKGKLRFCNQNATDAFVVNLMTDKALTLQIIQLSPEEEITSCDQSAI